MGRTYCAGGFTENGGLDSSRGVQTPEGIASFLYPAGLPIRACAYAIDMLIQWLFICAAALIITVMKAALGLWVSMILIFAINWFYHVVCDMLFQGQSLGKRILGLRVVRSDGSTVNPGASFLRNLLRFADTFMFLCLIGLLSMILSPAFRRLGDWVADTLVVYTPSAQAPSWRSGAVRSDIRALTVSRRLSYEEKQAVLMFARRYPLLGPARADEIAHAYAETLRDTIPAGSGDPADNTGGGQVSDSGLLLGIAQAFSGSTL